MKTTLSLMAITLLLSTNLFAAGQGTTITPNGVIFPDGTTQTTAAGSAALPSGTTIISSINNPATAGTIDDSRVSPNVGRLNGANNWSAMNVFGAGLSLAGSTLTNVGTPVNANDAA